jgi:hypothetical protein
MVAAKTGTDKVDLLWKQIQEALQRNMSLVGPSTNGPSTSVRSMQKSETSHNSSQNQLLDRLIMQVNEAIRSLQRQGSEGRSSDIENARNLLSDAHSAKEVNNCCKDKTNIDEISNIKPPLSLASRKISVQR